MKVIEEVEIKAAQIKHVPITHHSNRRRNPFEMIGTSVVETVSSIPNRKKIAVTIFL